MEIKQRATVSIETSDENGQIREICATLVGPEEVPEDQNATVRKTLLAHFPWLEQGNEDVSGSDVIQQLQDLYYRTGRELGLQRHAHGIVSG